MLKKVRIFWRCEQRGGVRRDAAGGLTPDFSYVRLTRLRSDAVMCLGAVSVSVLDSESASFFFFFFFFFFFGPVLATC